MEHMGVTYRTQKMTQRIRGFHHTNAPACRISQWGAPNHETARKLWRTALATRWRGKCCFPKAPSKWLHNGKAGKRGKPVSCRLNFGRCFGRVTDLAYAMRPYLDISSWVACTQLRYKCSLVLQAEQRMCDKAFVLGIHKNAQHSN